MPTVLDPAEVSDFVNKDTNRIVARMGKVLAYRSPYLNVLGGGTIPNISDTVRSIVQEQAVSAHSLVNPTFADTVNICGTTANRDKVGSKEYDYKLQTLRGRGPLVCVHKDKNAFKGAYIQGQMALESKIQQLINADIRHTLASRSGLKLVASSTTGFDTALQGDVQAIDTDFEGSIPDAALSFRLLHRATQVMREEMLVDPYEVDDGQEVFRFIGSIEQLEAFRDELGISTDHRYLAAGSYKIGEKTIRGYRFEGPYRGVAFGVDQQPLRFNELDGSGNPIYIEPEIEVATTKGHASRRNPAWIKAAYEVGLLMGKDSFDRLTPEQYTGEGTFKFNPQLWMGELKWHYEVDNGDNEWGDFGWHKYQIMRAYRPFRPHSICAIAYKRCAFDNGLTACNSTIDGV